MKTTLPNNSFPANIKAITRTKPPDYNQKKKKPLQYTVIPHIITDNLLRDIIGRTDLT